MERLLWFAVCLTGSLSQNSSPDGDQDHSIMFSKEPRVTEPTQKVEALSRADIEEALNYGFKVSSELLREKTPTTRDEGNTSEESSNLHFNFHAPSEVSLDQSCVGMGFIQATKFLQEKHFQGMDGNITDAVFNGMEMERELCYRVVEKVCGVRLGNISKITCSPESPYRSYNGSCNNLNNPLWGMTSTPFARFLEPAYGDGVNSLRGSNNSDLPSPRKISVELQNTTLRRPLDNLTMMVMQWGQILSHDLSLAPEAAVKENGTSKPIPCCLNGVQRSLSDNVDECQPIDTSDDTFYSQHGKACMRFVRSLTANKGCTFGAREQLNQQSSFVDASMVYGAKEALAFSLRTFENGTLKGTWIRGKPFDFLTKKTKCKRKFDTCFASGDGRVDEAAGLTSLHTLFHRFHNAIVPNLYALNPHWNDEILYQEVRRIVGALMQQITYKEYLPLILGPEIMEMFQLKVLDDGHLHNYHNGCNPSAANGFSAAAFRFGHSMIKEEFINGVGKIPLQGNFFNISNFLSGKICPSSILEGLTEDTLGGNDAFMTPVVSQHLFAPFGKAGLDLMALNIQRGRDHGIPGYVKWRSACKLSVPVDCDELMDIMNEDYTQAFKAVYKNVGDIDLFPAGLAEYPIPGALVGPTFAHIIGQQFQNSKLGDRFWFENGDQPKPFSSAQLTALRNVSLSTILCRCSSIKQMQPQAFLSQDLEGNSLVPCNSYEPLDLSPWQE